MKPLLNSKAVCELLDVSPAALSRMVHSNRIPYVLLTSGKTKLTVRFREEELEKWLDRRSRGAEFQNHALIYQTLIKEMVKRRNLLKLKTRHRF